MTEFARRHGDDELETAAILSRAGELHTVARGSAARFGAAPVPWVDVIADAVACFHNHPSGQPWPSALDQAQQIATAIPWAIVPRGGVPFWFGDGVEPPTFDRPFRWGVTDCYGFVRAALRECFGIKLGNYSRAWDFGKAGERLFEPQIEREGFEVIEGGVRAAVPGDVVLLSDGADKPATHCAVVLADGRAWHHRTPLIPYSETHRPRAVRLELLQRFAHRLCRRA